MAKKKSDRFTLRTWVTESMGFRDQEASQGRDRRRAESLLAPADAGADRGAEEADFQPTRCSASGTDTLPPYTTRGINAFPAETEAHDRAPVTGELDPGSANGAMTETTETTETTEAVALSDREAKKAKKAARKAAKLKALKEEWAREAGVAAPPAPMGTAKGVETMFRNAFRTEMELLALAATKANIMISLNGFIVSALMVSGAFIFSSSPEFLVPAGIFMLTAAASIVCALLSASPERVGRLQATWRWLKDVFRRKARLRDFKARVSHNPTVHFFGDSPNILIYEDRAKIPKDRYW